MCWRYNHFSSPFFFVFEDVALGSVSLVRFMKGGVALLHCLPPLMCFFKPFALFARLQSALPSLPLPLFQNCLVFFSERP